jgi:hypothetical protein
MPDYEPFGNEWQKEMTRFSKKELIEMVKDVGQELEETTKERARLLVAVQAAYKKHHMNDDNIGWEELSEILHDGLCFAMGDDGYCAWVDAA